MGREGINSSSKERCSEREWREITRRQGIQVITRQSDRGDHVRVNMTKGGEVDEEINYLAKERKGESYLRRPEVATGASLTGYRMGQEGGDY